MKQNYLGFLEGKILPLFSIVPNNKTLSFGKFGLGKVADFLMRCGNVTKMGPRETKSEAKGVRMGGEMDGGRGIGNQ